MKSIFAWSPNELQRIDLRKGHQDSSPSNGHQGDKPYYIFVQQMLSCSLQTLANTPQGDVKHYKLHLPSNDASKPVYFTNMV